MFEVDGYFGSNTACVTVSVNSWDTAAPNNLASNSTNSRGDAETDCKGLHQITNIVAQP